MTRYARHVSDGESVFSTLRLRPGRPERLTDLVAELRGALTEIATERPFRQDALVILPDHLHAVWTVPRRDRCVGLRWTLVQSRICSTTARRGALWQPRIEHAVLATPEDFDRHVEFCVQDPVRHRLVARPQDWPHVFLHPGTMLRRIDPDRPFGLIA